MKKFKQIFDPTFLKGGEFEIGSIKNGWHKCWTEKKVFKFTWEYCYTCECMFVRCPMCGNNCCNAGFGNVTKDYKPAQIGNKKAKICPVCNLAYQYQDAARLARIAPKPTVKQLKQKPKVKYKIFKRTLK